MAVHTLIATCESVPPIATARPPVTAGKPPACTQPKGPDTYPLLPLRKIRLFAPHGQGEWFARLFHDTWGQIPLGSRRSIRGHWRKPCPALCGLLGPQISLLDDWSDRQRSRGLLGDKAVVSWKGHRLRFWRRIVAAYPDALVKDLIAHELAHVYQESRSFEFEDAYECEEDADWRVERWGFSSEAMDEWDLAHGVSVPLDWARLSRSHKRRLSQRMDRNGR